MKKNNTLNERVDKFPAGVINPSDDPEMYKDYINSNKSNNADKIKSGEVTDTAKNPVDAGHEKLEPTKTAAAPVKNSETANIEAEPAKVEGTKVEDTPEGGTEGSPLGNYLSVHWKEIAIATGAIAAVSALIAILKRSSKSIKLRFNKSVKTLARMQKDFTMNKNGLDMRAVLPGVGSKITDFFTRMFSGSMFAHNNERGMMGKKSSRKYKDGVIGLYPFCGRFEEEIDNDYTMAQKTFSNIKFAADQQAEEEKKHTDESYNGKPVYQSFSEMFANDPLFESENKDNLNESILSLIALAPAVIRGGMFIVNKFKDGKKVEGGETAVQVTKQSTREICYAIMNNFFEKYISFEQVSKRMGVDVKGLSDIDNSTIDKFSELLKKYSNPDAASALKQYDRLKKQYDKMCKHYFNIGDGIIANFKKYTKAEDEKHENLLVAANEKLSAMWDEQKDKYENLFPYVLEEIVSQSHYQDYIDFILENVIPVFRTGIAGDADYILDVMPKRGDMFLLQQTAQSGDTGNKVVVIITKEYNAESKDLEMRFVGLYKGDVKLNQDADNSVTLTNLDAELDRKVYGKKPVTLSYSKFMALNPHIIENRDDFNKHKLIDKKKLKEDKQKYLVPIEEFNNLKQKVELIIKTLSNKSGLSEKDFEKFKFAIIEYLDDNVASNENFKARILGLCTDTVKDNITNNQISENEPTISTENLFVVNKDNKSQDSQKQKDQDNLEQNTQKNSIAKENIDNSTIIIDDKPTDVELLDFDDSPKIPIDGNLPEVNINTDEPKKVEKKNTAEYDIEGYLKKYFSQIPNCIELQTLDTPQQGNGDASNDNNANVSTGTNTAQNVEQQPVNNQNPVNSSESTSNGEVLDEKITFDGIKNGIKKAYNTFKTWLKSDKKEDYNAPNKKVIVKTDNIDNKVVLSTDSEHIDMLHITFNEIHIEAKSETPVKLETCIIFYGTKEEEKEYLLLNISVPVLGSVTNIILNDKNAFGDAVTETVVELCGPENLIFKQAESEDPEHLNDSIRESFKFDIDYTVNMTESAYSDISITKNIKCDGNCSEYHILSESIWDNGSYINPKQTLYEHMRKLFRTGKDRNSVMEYVKANGNVNICKYSPSVTYSINKPNGYANKGCSLYECNIALKFNNKGVIANAMNLGVYKITL